MRSVVTEIRVFDGRQSLDGLKPARITQIGEVLIFAGRNGSGKTRILSAIRESLKRSVEIVEKNDISYSIYIKRLCEKIEQNRSALNNKPSPSEKYNIDINLTADERELSQLLSLSFSPGCGPTNTNIIEIRPQFNFNFKDPNQWARSHKDEVAKAQSSEFNLNSSSEEALIRIEIASDDFLFATHQNSKQSADIKAQKIELYNVMKSTLSSLAGVEIDFDSEMRHPILDGIDLYTGSNRLSNGQKRLLDFASNFPGNKIFDKNTILLIDEPELFLHPAAITSLIDKWRQAFPNLQMFIATHCVPLIAHLGYENVWWLENGEAQRVGKTPARVLDGLLGGADNIERLQSLTLEPARQAALTFAIECLDPPKVVSASGRDPQAGQLATFVKKRIDELGSELQLLDYGAGKCRLLSALQAEFSDEAFKAISYVAFDPSTESRQTALDTVSAVYGGSEYRYFNKFSELMDAYDHKKFDIVVMCNVLHEISPRSWIEIFDQIKNTMNEESFLLIIEDQLLPHGELAHSEGFIIADSVSIRKLFSLSEAPLCITASDMKYKDRLSAFYLRKEQLNLTSTTIVESLRWTQAQSLRKIEELRSSMSDYNSGTRFALYSQQYVNSSLALSKMVPSE